MPPDPGNNSSRNVRCHIPWITNRPRHNVRANYLKEDGPYDQVKSNFTRSRRLVVPPQFQPSLKQQEGRQGTRNQQQVVEMVVQKPAVDPRFENPSVERVERTGRHEQPVPQVAERVQSSAKITMPYATATPIFKSKATIIIQTFQIVPNSQI
jgi:hypothetical protein